MEDATLSFTLLTSPVQWDSDGDGLNDSEEVTNGADGWIPDPLKADTDGDGASDPVDIDPLQDLMVKVTLEQIHHGGAWWDPELVGVIRVDENTTWVSKHEMGSADGSDDHTASFNYSYHPDVPDDASTVNVRVTAWSVNWYGDSVIEEGNVTYTLGLGLHSYYISGGSSWITFDVDTVALGKAHTLAITDGNATVQADSGQVRYVAQDRYLVFLVNASYDYGAILEGMNALVIPRTLYVASQLQARLETGNTYPLDDAAFYAEDVSQAEMTEAVAAVSAGEMSGFDAYSLLQYLLHNATGNLTSQAVDVTGYVPVLNLPTDALQIVPWEGVVNGPTGALPATFWQKVGAAATALVNVLVEAGQLIYGGLVALAGFFVALGDPQPSSPRDGARRRA